MKRSQTFTQNSDDGLQSPYGVTKPQCVNHELPLIVGWNLHIYINSIFSQCHFEMAKVSCDFETYFVRHACGQFAADG